MNVAVVQESREAHEKLETWLRQEERRYSPGRNARRMGFTRVRLPLGGCASTDPGEVRSPRLHSLFIGLGISVILLTFLMWAF